MRTLLLYVCICAVSAQSLFAAETVDVAALQQQFMDLQRQFTDMKTYYDTKIAHMQKRIDELESGNVDAAPQTASVFNAYSGNLPSQLPDISVVGVTSGMWSDKTDVEDNHDIVIKEIEMAFQGYVYPWARYDVFLAVEREEAEYHTHIEEAFATFFEVPFPYIGSVPGFGAVVGKKFIDIGNVNPVHGHEWTFVTRPAVHEVFFGEEGLNGTGVMLSYTLPLPFFLQLDVGAIHIDGHEHDHDNDAEHHALGIVDETYWGRLWTSLETTRNTELETGISYIKGEGGEKDEMKDRVQVVGADMTFRFFGEEASMITFMNEVYYMRRDIPDDNIHRTGFFNYLEYKVNKTWSFGMRHDWVETPFEERETLNYLSFIAQYSFSDMFKLKSEYQYDLEDNNNTFWLELVTGLGPHTHGMR